MGSMKHFHDAANLWELADITCCRLLEESKSGKQAVREVSQTR